MYNFTNQPITTYLAHANPMATANSNTRIKTNMNLDAANRVLQVFKTINDQDSTKRLIAQHTYDQMGQLMQKQIGQTSDGGFLETQDYTYNIRGWLKGINRDYADSDNSRGANDRWFGMELSYDWGFDSSQLNGNISGNRWRSKGDGRQRAYGFGYDDANRILYADFNQYGTAWDKTAGVDFSSTMGNGADPSTAYDENGNIRFMYQKGWQVGGSTCIDSLTYTYQNNSNKLMNVIDGENKPLTTLGDFRTSSLSPYYSNKTTAALDYSYDLNGNMTRDLNKDIGTLTTDGIIYNHLNLPWQITVRGASGTKGTITYIYDAAGNKLKKMTNDTAGNLQTVTTYIGAFQYQGTRVLNSGTPSDTLQFFGDEEGRIRLKTDTTGGHSNTSFKYDYFLKDHLGNTRMVLTDEHQSDQYPMATMEMTDSSLENIYYTMLDDTRSALPPGYPTDTTTNPNNYVAKLHVGSDNQPVIGPGMVLKVMAGDQFSVRVNSWYQLNGATPQQPANSPLTDIVSAMIAGLGRIQGESPVVSALQSNNAPLSNNVVQFLRDTGTAINESKPKAFLNWILFDNQFNFVQSSSGFQQVGTDGALTPNIMTNLPVNSSGYLYIYTSNATPNVDVFFDNLQVTHTRGPLLEEDHYYPFGLTMAGISDKAIKNQYAENKYKFNQGTELQNKEFSDGSGLEMYSTEYRGYDPQIGRFWQQDPLTELNEGWSPYSFVNDNPINLSDPLGLDNDSTGPKPKPNPGVDVKPMQEVVVTHKKKDCKTCNAPSPANSAGAAPAGVAPLPVTPVNPLTPVGPPAKIIEIGTAAESEEGLSLLGILGRIGGTVGGLLIPTPAPGEGPNWHPYPLTNPYPGHANNMNNWDTHLIYEIYYNPPAGASPTLKFGITDLVKRDDDRPEEQMARLKAIYGASVDWKVKLFAPNNSAARAAEQGLVDGHYGHWGYAPIEQYLPKPSQLKR